MLGKCLSGCTGYNQSSTWKNWRCSSCDFDLCGKCYDHMNGEEWGNAHNKASGYAFDAKLVKGNILLIRRNDDAEKGWDFPIAIAARMKQRADAMIFHTTRKGQDCLDVATDEEVRRVLRKKGAGGWTPLHVAAFESDLDAIDKCLAEALAQDASGEGKHVDGFHGKEIVGEGRIFCLVGDREPSDWTQAKGRGKERARSLWGDCERVGAASAGRAFKGIERWFCLGHKSSMRKLIEARTDAGETGESKGRQGQG